MSLRTLAFAVFAALAGTAGSAQAICTAAQIIANEQFCPPGTGACLISRDYTIEDGCTLDFGSRAVTLQPAGSMTIGSRAFTLRAGPLVINGRINGVGNGTGARGGMVTIEAAGNFTLGQSGEIDVNGNRSGGHIVVHADGSMLLSGSLQARDLTSTAAGGLISLTATGNISTANVTDIDARGGIDSDGGGEIDVSAGGNLTLLNDLSVFGFDGGFIVLEAGGKITMQSADASGRGDAGSGGCVDLLAGAGAEVKGEINVTGATGLFMSGGCGGLVCLDGGLGEMRIATGAVVNADGASPDGGGGQIALLARGNVVIAGTMTARGPLGETCGGDICIDAGVDVQVTGSASLDVSGGDAGGDLEIAAGRNAGIVAVIDASGRQSGGLGGDVTLRAGIKGRGTLTVGNTVDVSTDAACSEENGCGQAGITDLAGCDITFTGTLLASGPHAGENLVTARELLNSLGMMNATRTVTAGTIGLNRIVHRALRAPMLQTAGINPAAVLVPVATCPVTGGTEPSCLTPCPVCGNNIVEFPETCDLGMMPPTSCSGGCSAFCQAENCDDGLFCTADSCDQAFGCVNLPMPDCREPTATATGTPPTATATRTASATQTATVKPSASATGTFTPSATPSATPVTPTATSTPPITATASATATISPISTITASATPTHTGAPSATAPATTATAASTATETASLETTPTALPACPGDCNGSDDVTVNELILGVNIALGNTGAGVCPAFDGDASGTVTIGELIAAVNAALGSC